MFLPVNCEGGRGPKSQLDAPGVEGISTRASLLLSRGLRLDILLAAFPLLKEPELVLLLPLPPQ